MKFQDLAVLDAKLSTLAASEKEVKEKKTAKKEHDKLVKSQCISLQKQLEAITNNPAQLTDYIIKRRGESPDALGFSDTGLKFFRDLYQNGKEKAWFSFALSYLRSFLTVSEQIREVESGNFVSVNTLIERAITQKYAFKGADRSIIGFPQYVALFASRVLTVKEEVTKDGKTYDVTKLAPISSFLPSDIVKGEKELIKQIADKKWYASKLPAHLINDAKALALQPAKVEPKK